MLKRLRQTISRIPADSLVALTGVLFIGTGVWMLSPAWSLIAVGSLFCLDSALLGRRK